MHAVMTDGIPLAKVTTSADPAEGHQPGQAIGTSAPGPKMLVRAHRGWGAITTSRPFGAESIV